MTQLMTTVPLQESLRDHRQSLVVPTVGFHTIVAAGQRMAALCQEKVSLCTHWL